MLNTNATASYPAPSFISKMGSSDVKKSARDFESMFVSEMTSHMFKGLKTDGMMGGGNAEETYRSLLINAISDKITEKQGLGINDALQKSLLAMQETN